MNNSSVSRPFLWICSFLVALVFCIKYSITTSPLFNITGVDSSMFYLMGKSWMEGYLPYVSLWDHKGPLIFFINGLGHLLTGSKLGVFIIQTIHLSVFVYITFITFKRYFSNWASCGLTLTSLCWLVCSYEGGNLTEEYLLPYLALSIYLTCKWLDDFPEGLVDHNPWNAFLLGLILGFSFLTRLTNALGSCGMMLGIGILLLMQKRWKNLCWNIAAYCLGFLAISLPFILYFYMHGALNEMLFGAVLFNFSNVIVTAEKDVAFGLGAEAFIKFCILAVNSLGLVLVSLLLFFVDKSRRANALVWFCASAFLSFWFIKSNLSAHYRTIALPFFPVLFYSVTQLKRPFPRFLSIAAACGLILIPVYMTGKKLFNYTKDFDDSQEIAVLEAYVRESIPQDDLASFVQCEGKQGLYLKLDIVPCYHNFSFQQTQSAKSDVLKEDVIKEFSSCKAKYILVNGDAELIQSILEENYHALPACPSIPSFVLYERID